MLSLEAALYWEILGEREEVGGEEPQEPITGFLVGVGPQDQVIVLVDEGGSGSRYRRGRVV